MGKLFKHRGKWLVALFFSIKNHALLRLGSHSNGSRSNHMTRTRQQQTRTDVNAPALPLVAQTKAVITKLSLQVAGPGNPLTLPRFLEHLAQAGFTVPKRTLYEWREDIKKDPEHFNHERTAGGHFALTKEQEALLTGYVLHSGCIKLPVGFTDVQTFVCKSLNVELSLPTVRTYCAKNGISLLVAKVRSMAQAAVTDQQ